MQTKIIRAEELRIGNTITGRVFHENGETVVEELKRGTEVKELGICPGRWRTHVHVNNYGCWDGRSEVQVQ